MDNEPGSRRQRLTNRKDTWSARCGESRTPGAAGGPGRPTRSNPGRAPRSDPSGWAGSDPTRRFDDLMNLVSDRAFLMHAWQRVSTNAGKRTAGIDRATVAWIETEVGIVVFLDGIRESLKSGEFRPVEVRQVMIPKKGSSGKLRKLEDLSK